MLFKKKTVTQKTVLTFLLAIASLEITLRLFLGLGDPPLYIEDNDFEYIYAPNQSVKRFGKYFITNEYSMRSDALSNTDEIRILKIGDSVVNGGSMTDHDSLASTLLEKELTSKFKKKIRVLNISAGSWGPDNAFAYIQRYGNFNAAFFVLVFSSHDLYDSMEHEKIVGINPAFPNKKPFCAIGELWNRYVIPTAKEKLHIAPRNHKIDNSLAISVNSTHINSGWNNFFNYAKKNNISLLIVLHPTTNEIQQKKYDENGQKIIALLDSMRFHPILELNNNLTSEMYRDDIHYNEKGQKKLAAEIYPYLSQYVQKQIHSNSLKTTND